MPPQETHVVQNAELSLLYERFAPALLASLCQQVTHRQDAEDLLLEVFLAALEYPALTALPADRQLAWLRRVARNKVIDHYRHTSVFTIQPLDQTPPSEDQRVTPEHHAEAQETWVWLAQAIGQLPAEQRELLRLRYGQELRLTQIATLLEKPEGTVRKMLSRILRRLRAHYEQEERSDLHA